MPGTSTASRRNFSKETEPPSVHPIIQSDLGQKEFIRPAIISRKEFQNMVYRQALGHAKQLSDPQKGSCKPIVSQQVHSNGSS
jgi:hypothetical protein